MSPGSFTELRPTGRVGLWLLGVAIASAASTSVVGVSASLPLLGLLALMAALDARAVLALDAPVVSRPAQLEASLRRPLSVPLLVEAAEHVQLIAPEWPHELGGPVSPSRVSGRASYQICAQATPRSRGRHRVSEVWLWLGSPRGLWRRRVVRSAPCQVDVWPDLLGPNGDSIGWELSDEGRARTLGPAAVGSELRGLRPFQRGDDPRQVDWKATARARHPIVRQWQPDRRRWVVVVIDAGRLMRAEHDGESKLDAALRALSRLGLAAQARGDRLGVLVYDDQLVRWLPPSESGVSVHALLRALADVRARGVESDPSRALPELLSIGRRALVLWITDVLDSTAAERLIGAVATVARRHLPIVALMRDPALDAAFRARVSSTSLAYHRAAAELLARRRSDALEALRARGVPALDLSMAELAAGVVQRYVQARASAPL